MAGEWTKGTFLLARRGDNCPDDASVKGGVVFGSIVNGDGTHVARIWGDISSAKGNAALIVEAFNVANETGKTPRQLADENRELREVLTSARGAIAVHSSGCADCRALVENILTALSRHKGDET